MLPLRAMAEASPRDGGDKCPYKVGAKVAFVSSSAVAVVGGKETYCRAGEDGEEGGLELCREHEPRHVYEHLPFSIERTPNSWDPFGVR